MNEIVKIKISEIDDFKNHPYKVELGDELNTLVESIKLNGLLVPIVVRRKEDNRYELLSGHRRKKVYEILGNDYEVYRMYILVKSLNSFIKESCNSNNSSFEVGFTINPASPATSGIEVVFEQITGQNIKNFLDVLFNAIGS